MLTHWYTEWPPWASIVLTTKNLGPYCHLNHWKWTGYHLRLKQDLPEGPTLQFWKVSKSCFFSFFPFLPFCLAYKSSAIHQQKLPLLEELSAKDTSACESERTNTVKNNLWKNPWILRVTLKWYFSDFFSVKGTISDRPFQTSLFSKPPDIFAYSERTPLYYLCNDSLRNGIFLGRETILCCWELIIAGDNSIKPVFLVVNHLNLYFLKF